VFVAKEESSVGECIVGMVHRGDDDFAKPITINIDVNDKEDVYDIVMFAESMGTIPPNTALMVVTTATNRYEINITSTEQTSGSIRLKVKR
jgi:hypothetical protein